MNDKLLAINILGAPVVTWREEPLAISRRQARALLYRLGAAMQPVARERLLLLFWPDVPDAKARRNLTRLLSALRKELLHPDILQTTRTAVSLSPDLATCDAARFATLAEGEEAAQWETAVSLVCGSFLSGFILANSPEFDAWQTQQQHRFERRYLALLAKLVRVQRQRGQLDSAIDYAQRYLTSDDLAEEIHRQLIELYAQTDQRTLALRQFETCVLVLERELGVAPLPETRAAYEAARDGKQPPPLAKHPEPEWATLPGLDLPLIGRDAAWAQLNEAYGRLQRGGVIFISGEPGVGKSRLMQSFATIQNRLILTGSNPAGSQTMPYEPLVQALRQALPLRDRWRHAQPNWLVEAARLLPELREYFPDLSAAVEIDPAQAQAHLFAALTQLFHSLATDAPMLLCLDDVHWADEATLGWLQYVTKRLNGSQICIIATYRTDKNAALRQWRRALSRANLMMDVVLSGLPATAVRAILKETGVELGDLSALATRIHHATAGNAFFVLETIRELLETNQLADPPDNLPLPATVRETILRRAGRLSPLAQQIMEITAVLSANVTLDLIAETAGRDGLDTAVALEELTQRQLLKSIGKQFECQHELAREAIYQNISSWRRRLLHQRAAHALQNKLPEKAAEFVTIAHHFKRSGNSRQAADLYQRAGELRQDAHTYDVAIQNYAKALENHKVEKNYLQAASTLLKISLCHQARFEFQRAQETLEESFQAQKQASNIVPGSESSLPQPLRLAGREPLSLDPTVANDYGSSQILDQLFSGLVHLSPDNTILPAVAKKWEVKNRGCTYIFYLREDACWNDGHPLSADDFLYAWNRSLRKMAHSPLAHAFIDVQDAPDHAAQNNYERLPAGISTPNSQTIVIHLKEPNSYFLYLLAKSFAFPVPKHAVELLGDDWSQPARIISNGPFQLDSAKAGHSMRLIPSTHFYGENAGNIAHVDIFWIKAWQERLAQYEAGDLDVLSLWNLPPNKMKRVRQRLAAEYVTSPWLQNTYITLNTRRSPFADVRVRQAFVMAINRTYLTMHVKQGFDSPAVGGLIPPGMFAHSPNIGLRFAPEKARNLLAEAGYAGGKGFPTITGIIFSAYAPVQEHLSKQWAKHLSVNVQWEVLDWREYQTKIQQKTYDLVFNGWVADYPDPDNILRLATHMNRTGWRNTRFVELINVAKNLPSLNERRQMYQEADKILIDNVGVMPLSYGRWHLLVNPRIKRFPSSSLRYNFWKDILIESPPQTK